MDAESTSGFGDISFAIGEDAMDMFPFGLRESGDWDCGFVFIHLDLRTSFLEGIEDIVGIGGFGEEVGGSQANGIDGGSDASEPGENEDLDVGSDGFEFGDERETGLAWHAEIDNGEGGAFSAKDLDTLVDISGDGDAIATIFKGHRQAVAKHKAIVDEEDALGIFDGGDVHA